MTEQDFSTSIHLELQGCNIFGLSFACLTCGHVSYVTLEPGEDGIVISNYRGDSSLLNLWRYNPCAVATGNGRLSIFCGVCRSGRTRVTLSPAPAGTSYLPKKDSYYQGNRTCPRCKENSLGSFGCVVCGYKEEKSNDIHPDLPEMP